MFKRKLRWLSGSAIAVVVLAIAGPLIFFNVIEGKAPAHLTLPSVARAKDSSVVSGPLSGTWVVGKGSVAGYRVQEILFGQDHTAVGRTSEVSGGITISGPEVTKADFSVDMATVKTGQASRDVQFSSYIMDTSQYPKASFHLTKPIQLNPVLGIGQTVTTEATGELTLRGTTKVIAFPVKVEQETASLIANIEIPVTFSAWHIPSPNFTVAKVADNGLIEVLLQLVNSKS